MKLPVRTALMGTLMTLSLGAQAFAPVCPDGTHAIPVPLPTPRPPDGVPTTPPTPEPVNPNPEPKPKPKYPPPPVPPPTVEEPADPVTLGIPLLDDALQGKASPHLLPYWHHYPWQKIERPLTWTRWLYDHLRAEGDAFMDVQPKDAAIFCPNYKALNLEERRLFWMRLMSAVIELESTYNTRRAYHSIRVEPGLYSIGLLMLSLPSSKQSRFQCTMVKGNDDLFDWRKNLTCGFKIMKHYYLEDKSITGRTSLSKEDSRWMGLARYWEPFRDQRLRQDGGYEAILKKVKQKRRGWLKDAESSKHPGYRDSSYKDKGEKDIERIARLTNTMPFCLTGAEDEFEVEPVIVPPAMPVPPLNAKPGDPAYLCMPDPK